MSTPQATLDSTIYPAMGMIELCSVAQGLITQDALLKKAHVTVEWARIYNPGKYVIYLRGGVEEVAEAMQAARYTAGEFLIDHVEIYSPHSELQSALQFDQDIPSYNGELQGIGVLECYSLAATIRAADAGLKEAKIRSIALRLAPTLGGKGCFMFAGPLEDLEAANIKMRAAAGIAFIYHSTLIPRPHSEITRTLITTYTDIGTNIYNT